MTEELAIAAAKKFLVLVQHKNVYSFLCNRCSRLSFTTWSTPGGFCSKKCAGLFNNSRPKTGEEHHVWRGGSHLRDGYVYIYQPGMPVGYKYRAEHAVVMEKMLGRKMIKGESVHHINGLRNDNRPENLQLWVTPQHSGQRPIDLARWVVKTYPAEVRAMLECESVLSAKEPA